MIFYFAFLRVSRHAGALHQSLSTGTCQVGFGNIYTFFRYDEFPFGLFGIAFFFCMQIIVSAKKQIQYDCGKKKSAAELCDVFHNRPPLGARALHTTTTIKRKTAAAVTISRTLCIYHRIA